MKKGYKGLGMEGAVARWYENTTRKDLPEFQRLAGDIAGGLTDGSAVLEIAPGPGFLAIELAKRGIHVTGIDISQTFVELARRNAAVAGVTAQFESGDAAHLPFDDETFDFIVCRAAFKNFSDPEGALHEMQRVLKPGGRGLIIDLRRDASMREISEYVDRLRLSPLSGLMTKFTFRFMLLKRAYTKPEFETMLSGVPFRDANVCTDNVGLQVTFAA